MTGRAFDSNDPIGQTPLIIPPAGLWVMADSAGFKGADRVTMAAICLAESSGNAHVISRANTNGTHDFGVAQINSVHTDLANQYDWSVAVQNLQMAHVIWQSAGGSFSPWTTYPNAANLKMNTVIAAVKGAGQDPTSGDASKVVSGALDSDVSGIANSVGANSLSDSLTALVGFVKKIGDIKTWISIGYIVDGIILIGIAVVKMVSSEAIKSGVVKLAAKAL
jgi:hypothetical protein